MPISLRTVVNATTDFTAVTYLYSELALQSSWSHPDVPVLVFADNKLPGASVQNHGGIVASGTPLQLLFWGDWWNTAEGNGKLNLYISRVQALLASNYFSELEQYGIAKPHWRGAKIVTEPAPPAAFNSTGDEGAVPDLIDALIDDDVFPDPDDEKITLVVFMPKGFTVAPAVNANGSHTKDYNYTFPWDKDWYWVAWVRSFEGAGDEDPENAIRTFTHELVEMLSDPELDGWYTDPQGSGEIGDAAVSGTVKQSAWVNGAKVQGYWSNRHSATVIPIDRDYQARILGTIRLDHVDVVNGTFVPDPEDSRLCDLLPQCCLDKREYKLTLVKRDETVRLSVETQRYRQPQIAWTVEGTPVTANMVLSLQVIAGTFEGRHSKFGSTTVMVQCKLSNNVLTLSTVGTQANFDITVACKVTDGSITGNLKTNVVAAPALSIGFVGAELTVDPEYLRQRAECEKAATDMFKKAGVGKSTKPKIGDPVEFGPDVLVDIPAYARLQQYAHARQVVDLARMAHAFLPAETATALTASLVSDVPALQAALAVRSTSTNSTGTGRLEPSDGPTT